MSTLTKQIKELQEKNFKLEFDANNRKSELEKKNFKEMTDEIKRLEAKVKEKQMMSEGLENKIFNLESRVATENSNLYQKIEEYK